MDGDIHLINIAKAGNNLSRWNVVEQQIALD
jgi:hypothetical protein